MTDTNINRKLQLQVSNYAINLYPKFKDDLFNSIADIGDIINPQTLIEDIFEHTINNIIPMLVAFDLTNINIEKEIDTTQDDVSFFNLNNRTYKTTLSINLQIEDTTPAAS